MPKTSSEDRLAATLEDLTHILKNPHPKQPFLDQGTPTNDAIRKLQEIFNPPAGDTTVSQNGVETKPPQPKKTKQHAVPRVEEKSKTKERHPNGTIILRKFGGKIHKGEVKRYNEERKFPYWIDYDDGDSEELNHKQVTRYKSIDTAMDPIKRITRSSANRNQANLTKTTRESNPRNVTKKSERFLKLNNIAKRNKANKQVNYETAPIPSHFAMAVFDESTGKMMEMRELLHHPDPKVRIEWEHQWPTSLDDY